MNFKFKGMYTEAVIVATCLTLALILLGWLVWAVAGSLSASAIVAICFWRIVFVWVMDSE